jgi:anti-sigma B factor antagonist
LLEVHELKNKSTKLTIYAIIGLMNEKADVEIKDIESITVVSFNVTSLCDIAGIERVSTRLRQFIADSRPKKMVMDFTHVKFFTSQVLGLLLDIWRKLQADGGQMVISGIDPQLHRVFKITNLDKIFRFFADSQSAAKAFDNITKDEG